jgi:dipeptidyl aminopeptidase/acylaminoacyl peptidase
VNRIRVFAIVSLVMLVACQPQPSQTVVLPTQIDLNAISTSTAAAVTAQAEAQLALTLPPTWTPSPPPPAAPTETPLVITPTAQSGVNAQGTIYFVFNNDSIAALSGDGSSEQLILVSGAPADLTLSPDGTLLAYVADASGSAREVFISNLDGSYIQQVSCVGFARVVEPVWSHDSQKLAFLAAQTLDGPMDIYVADIVGSGQCPAGNNQRQLTQIGSQNLRDLTWSSNGEWIFFSNGPILAVNVETAEAIPALTAPTGFGPDFSLTHHPVTDELYYLKSDAEISSGRTGGTLALINTAEVAPNMDEFRGVELFASRIEWNADGTYLLISTNNSVLLLGKESGTSVQLVRFNQLPPQPALSPDAQYVAYVNIDPINPSVPQVYIVDKLGENAMQVTHHTEGAIDDLVWAP